MSEIPTYDRTCSCLKSAKERLKKVGKKGFITIDSVPKDYWY